MSINLTPPFHQLFSGKNECPKIELQSPQGATAEVYLHGAHVTSWKPVQQVEKLFLSEASLFGSGTAIRGGIPVIFPQFADEGPLLKHGFARQMDWALHQASVTENSSSINLVLKDNDDTRKIWDHAFESSIWIQIDASSLLVQLTVKNVDAVPFSFTSALHTYFKVESIENIKIHGLQGIEYIDTTIHSRPHTIQREEHLVFGGEVDRLYLNSPDTLHLQDGDSRLTIQSNGFKDSVIWNPWDQKCSRLKDMEPSGFRQMVCIEAAGIQNPVKLLPGEAWSGYQKLSL